MSTIVVSNRLPVVVESRKDGLRTRPGSGGLVTALSAVLRRAKGRWIGWPGLFDARPASVRRVLKEAAKSEGHGLVPVHLDADDYRGFYEGFSNEIVWPLFHDLPSRCNFDPDYWASYLAVQEKFADVVAAEAKSGDLVWVHDYQLMGVGQCLRERKLRARLCFFLHIPFPAPDIFAKLPWRTEILQSLLRYDVVGLQTARDLENFLDCVKRLLPEAQQRLDDGRSIVAFEQQRTVCGAFPIGIDWNEFVDVARSVTAEVRVAQLREDMRGQQVVLGVDRLDYTKGIPDRLHAFHHALRRYPELRRKATLIQVVVPSREKVPEYATLRSQIERAVSQINGEFGQPGWTPIQYLFRNLPRRELIAYYRLADVALVTPLKDGMNLVAKEYCACQVDGNGVLLLSEFAGAADQLGVGAILVNPYDRERLADAIRRAVLLPLEPRRAAMRRLRRRVRKEDVHHWVGRFLSAVAYAGGRRRSGARSTRRGGGE